MSENSDPFLKHYRGYFKNLLKWEELDALWQRLRIDHDKEWYVYAVGETPPQQPVDSEQLARFIEEIDTLLRNEHDEDYCGIVYVDEVDQPGFIKIYDPNNLGSSCGSGSAPPPLPGWILSQLPPSDLNVAFPPPANRRRWWQRVFGN
ncbi:MAG: hypothetical protein OQL05_05525 [Gammaproteobacteria bacterium]|nr:hypothetical protein [Gammaproteobacteria bacterium]MCW8972724.1 hypothetical protein [Gammaproteobacteria bacterium]MCW8993813.1 hypothetical protein [Gammaproteobacteria bacterium]